MRLLRFAAVIFALLVGHSCVAQHILRTLSYNGNTITLHATAYDTVLVEDPETGEKGKERLVITPRQKFALLNNTPVFQEKEAAQPVGSARQADLKGFLADLWAEEIDTIKRRGYSLELQIVIDEKGKLAYFEGDVSYFEGAGTDYGHLSKRSVRSLSVSMEKKISTITFVPAKKDKKAVPYYIAISKL